MSGPLFGTGRFPGPPRWRWRRANKKDRAVGQRRVRPRFEVAVVARVGEDGARKRAADHDGGDGLDAGDGRSSPGRGPMPGHGRVFCERLDFPGCLERKRAVIGCSVVYWREARRSKNSPRQQNWAPLLRPSVSETPVGQIGHRCLGESRPTSAKAISSVSFLTCHQGAPAAVPRLCFPAEANGCLSCYLAEPKPSWSLS